MFGYVCSTILMNRNLTSTSKWGNRLIDVYYSPNLISVLMVLALFRVVWLFKSDAVDTIMTIGQYKLAVIIQ